MGSSLRAARPDAPAKHLRPGDKRATVIAVAAQKGGVGKTTTSVTLAAAWARFFGKRVLLVDLDPQGHVNVALRDQVLVGGGPLTDVLADPRTLEVEDISTATRIPDLFLTPPDPELGAAEERLAGRIGKELVLRKALQITRSHYDLIVLDCPPHLGPLTLNALVAADRVLIPANPTALAVSGVEGLMHAIEEVRADLNPALEVLGVALTRVDGRNTRTNDAVLNLLEETWGDLLLPVRVGVANALSEAQLEGRDIYEVDPGCRGAEQYKALAGLLLERLES